MSWICVCWSWLGGAAAGCRCRVLLSECGVRFVDWVLVSLPGVAVRCLWQCGRSALMETTFNCVSLEKKASAWLPPKKQFAIWGLFWHNCHRLKTCKLISVSCRWPCSSATSDLLGFRAMWRIAPTPTRPGRWDKSLTEWITFRSTPAYIEQRTTLTLHLWTLNQQSSLSNIRAPSFMTLSISPLEASNIN